MKDLYNNHPIKFSLIISLMASTFFSLFIEPIIQRIQVLSFLRIQIVFPFPKDNPFLINISIIGILFFIAIIFYISICIGKRVIFNRIKKILPNDNLCNSCDKTAALTKQIHQQEERNEELLSKYNKDLPYIKLKNSLKKYFDKSEVLESLQLFSVTELPSIEKANHLNEVDICLHFIDGMAKESSNINALFNIKYKLEKTVYQDVKKLFDMRNQYYGRKNSPRNISIEENIQREAIRIFDLIKDNLNRIININDIKDYHYVYYKLLDILANVIIGQDIEYDSLIDSPQIEEQLKHRQKTGMIGTIFTEHLYCFYNDSSIIKKDRIYFSVPIIYKKKQLILLGICNKNNLRIATNNNYMNCCSQIYDDIKKALANLGGDYI